MQHMRDTMADLSFSKVYFCPSSFMLWKSLFWMCVCIFMYIESLPICCQFVSVAMLNGGLFPDRSIGFCLLVKKLVSLSNYKFLSDEFYRYS